MANLTNDVQIFDYTLSGETRDGNLREVYENDALRTALLLWVSSFDGDFIGNTPRGGYAFGALNSPLTEGGATMVQEKILYGIKNDFPVEVNVNSIQISIDSDKRAWRIELDVSAPGLDLRTKIDESIRAIE